MTEQQGLKFDTPIIGTWQESTVKALQVKLMAKGITFCKRQP